SGDEALDAFVEASGRRAVEARPGGPPPVGALLSVRTTGQWTALKEETATFTEEAAQLLADGQAWSFFERCGTHYVQAVRREPSAFVYLALYPADAAQRARWASQVSGWAGASPEDLLSLRVLDRMAAGAPWYAAVRADADEAFEVLEPGRPGEGAGALLGHALRATFGADRGRIAEVSLRPWSQLPAALTLLQVANEHLQGEPGRRERLHQRLQLLEWRALDRQALLAQAAEAGAGECRAALQRALAPFSWDGYYRCRSAARESLPQALEELAECRPVLEALDADALPAPCARVSFDEERFADPRKRLGTRYPLLMELGKRGDHLSADAAQLAPAPALPVALNSSCVEGSPGDAPAPAPAPLPPPKPWSQDDWDQLSSPPPPEKKPPAAPPPAPPKAPEGDGREGPICIDSPGGQKSGPLCLHPKGEKATSPPGAATASSPAPAAPPASMQPPKDTILDVSANRRPEGERRWPWWKKLLAPLFGWKAPEPLPRPIYRGAYEIHTLRQNGAGEVRLTEEAAALAKKDLAAFYRTCGTHRATQVVERKGVAYHYSPGGPGDREVTVLPYGVSQQAAGSDAFHPATVQGLFTGRARWLDQLSQPSAGFPEWEVLEPWSELLLESGVLQPHQLAPAR
ncbi:MAG TPA: hypothetical protein VND93_31145, partial [Myxococcales bacterium]|nr:hypothetical protein [Myxococcales bacterium]